jgi:gluconate kinase
MTIYLLFGEMGTGKNYIGERLAEHLGCQFFDGDDWIPLHLQSKIDRCESLTLEEVSEYVDDDLIPQLKNIQASTEMAVVAQALYRENDRYEIQDELGDQVVWIHVVPPSRWTHMWRLLSRKNGFRWALLGLMSKPYFEAPDPETTYTMVSEADMDVGEYWDLYLGLE